MEEKIVSSSKPGRFLRKRHVLLALCVVVAVVAAWSGYGRGSRMPLIFLIPSDYFGPVVALFDQKDGVDLVSAKDGFEVSVPENGVIRIKGHRTFDRGGSYPGSSIVFMLVDKDGRRRPMKEAINPWQEYDKDDNAHWVVGIRDVQGNLRKFPLSPADGFIFDDFPEAEKHEKMIMWHDSCRDRVFNPDFVAYQSGEKTAKELNIPPCAEFVVGSVDHVRTWPEWMFLRGKGKQEKLKIRNPAYESIQELVDEANARVARKKTLGNQ
ncbi:hypothetical protein [Burkholderia sp. Bp8963]|uniref:hypothetical protein n=1 Tax=Burkholderia sp. Bp8963 TaxID=2184547 RepID=UPI0021AB89A8|nr:hypothetical protein [Burkholderia sp. Bp8963]